MASKINTAGLTLSTEEANELSQLVFEAEFQNGVLSRDHAIETGIEHDKQIVFAGKIADGLKVAAGCVPDEGGTFALTEKVWSPKKFAARFTHCADDLANLLKLFAKAKRVNPDFYNRADSEEMGAIMSVVGIMLRETLPGKIWFSDTAADLHSGAGVFSTGTDLDLYNVLDGLWKQIFADIAAGGDGHVDITENAGVSYVAQALATDKAFDTLEAMVEEADPRLLEDPSAKFMVSRSLADNYKSTLRTKNLTGGFIEVTENGRQQLMFDGFKIEIRHDWDRFIAANEDNGTVLNYPHRAILTTPENIPVGTLSDGDFEELTSFYSQDDKANKIDVAFSLDAKHLQDYMTVAAY